MKPLAIALFYVVASAIYLASPAPRYVAASLDSAAHHVKCTFITCAAKTVKKK